MEKDQVFFWGVIAFILGVGSGLWLPILPVSLLLLAFALWGALVMAFPRRALFVLGLFLVVWSGGAWRSYEERALYQSLPPGGGEVRGEARVIADPEERDFYRHVVLRFERCESEGCPVPAVLWQAPLSFAEPAGTRLDFSCVLALPENFAPDFDYRMFLAKDGIGSVCVRAGQAEVLEGDFAGRLRSWLYVPKHTLERGLSRILSEPEAGLAKGLLLGGNHYLPQALQESFTQVGLSHMIAVSGYNITLIAQMLLTLGLFVGLWRRQAVWTALIGIVFFVVMIGLPASAARAGAMASIVFIALQTGRLAQPVNALLFAGGVMLLENPLLLHYDLGFQLSFLATLGILTFAPYYERIAPCDPILKKFGEVLFLTLSVELFVLPVILLVFHSFSPLIIVGNFLVVLVPFAMAAAFIATLLFLIFPGAHVVVAWGAFALLTAITRGVEWLGSIKSTITVSDFSVTALVSWYILLAGLIVLLHRFCILKPYEQKT